MDDMLFDVVVIGAGTAGLTARRAAVKAGARTLIIEAGAWGTTCVRSGCMPSKLLLAAAQMAREANRSTRFGISPGTTRTDGRAVMARLHRERDRFLQGVYEEIDAIPEHEKIQGRAHFTGPNTLLIDDRVRVCASAIVIATGARSSVLPELEPVKERVLTSESVFELDDLPGSIAVVGAGPLGTELATAFSRLGVRTTLFDRGDSIGGARDPEVGRVARQMLAQELDLRLGSEIHAKPVPDGVCIRWHGASEAGEAVFDWVLVAAGRPPNLDALELEATGLALDEHGVPKYDRATLRCDGSTIFIAGDADHDRPVLHEASREGHIAGTNAARLQVAESEPPGTALSIVFTDPDIASIGESLASIGEDAAVGCCGFDAGRSLIEGRPGGMIRLYARRKDRVIAGGEMVGPAVEHLAHLVGVLVQQRVTIEDALKLPFYHPTYEEALRDCLRNLLQNLG